MRRVRRAAPGGVALAVILVAAFGIASGLAQAQPDGEENAAGAAPEDPAPEGDPAAGEPGAVGESAPAEESAPAGETPPADEADESEEEDANSPAAGGGNLEDAPVNLRIRRLEQRVQALKERAWRAKARTEMLKEAVLGGGVGARAGIVHKNKMGNSFRLIKLVYALDGTQIFARSDKSGSLHDQKSFDILTGPIAPGSHTISVLALYRGHGYGVFKYLKDYKFTVRSSHTFTATEGKATSIQVVAFEKGGVTTPLEDRPAIDFKVTVSEGAGK